MLVSDSKTLLVADLECSGMLRQLHQLSSVGEEESIMKARFHNQMPDIFYHLTNAGRVYLSDMRQSLDLRSQWTEFVFRPAKTHFFTEYIINPSDAHFMSDGFSLVVRDYLQLKIWDIRNNEKPVFSSSVSKAMMMSLGELYESNHIFDKFDLAVAPDSQTAVTGSYKGQFHVMSLAKSKENVEMIVDEAGEPEEGE